MKVLVDNSELGNPFEAAYGEFVILLQTPLLLNSIYLLIYLL